jgi:MarR family transcriptional regulator, organic hydroperoxide resistance regulator
MYLWELGPQRQTDLIRLVDSDAATMTRTIRRLEHAGFVRRSPSADDKRAYLIESTPAGRALRPQVEQIWNRLEEIVAGGVGEREQQTIRRVLVLRVVETFTFSLLGQLSGACGPGVAVA